MKGSPIGLTATTLILVFVQFEFSFDRYHSKADRIYRVYTQAPGRSFHGSDYSTVVPSVLGKAMEAEFPEVEASVTLMRGGTPTVRLGDKVVTQNGMFWAGPEIFSIFDFEFLKGNPRSALTEPNTIVLSSIVAQRLFGEENPLGKTLLLRERYHLTVTGVYRESPEQSHIRPLMIGSFAAYAAGVANPKDLDWGNSSFHAYVLLREGTRVEDLQAKFPAFTEKYLGASIRERGLKEPTKYFLQSLTDIHLHSQHINFDISKNGNLTTLYILMAIAAVILFTACINYMNLATARASMRAKEIGVRKVVGAARVQLMQQFLGESLVLTVIAAILAFILVEFSLPAFSTLVEREFDTSFIANGNFFVGFMLVTIVTGILAGSYPAFLLARLQPTGVLKGQTERTRRSYVRNALVVLQFAASTTLVVCLLVILSQMNYIQTKDLGYQREQVMVMNFFGVANAQKGQLLKEHVVQIPNVAGASVCTSLPLEANSLTTIHGMNEQGNPIELKSYQMYVDDDYMRLFEVQLVAGANASASNLNGYLVNETFAKQFGWGDPVGKTFFHNTKQVTVSGVVKDFNMLSLHLPIEPLLIAPLGTGWGAFLAVKVRTGDLRETMAQMQNRWEQLIQDRPFEFTFLDDEFNEMYKDERRFADVISYSATFAVVVASLGLFGLAAFVIEQRKKEIGVRKILGASLNAIVLTLSKEFLLLVALANVVALPLGYYLMSSWLENFAYRVEFGVGVFLVAALGGFLAAFLTVGVQSVRAATANPVDALRYE